MNSDQFVLIIVFLIIVIVVMYLIILSYRSTLKSKQMYDDMNGRMVEERRMIKEDRVKINEENKACKSELDKLIQENKQNWQSFNIAINQFEKLASKYIQRRIELLQLKRPDLKDSTASLYELQDLLYQKKNKQIDTSTYLNQVDLVFDRLGKK